VQELAQAQMVGLDRGLEEAAVRGLWPCEDQALAADLGGGAVSL